MNIKIFILFVPIVPLIVWIIWLLSNWICRGIVTDTVERKRIMEMVEAGKISPDEGKELLNALGNSSALRGEEKFSRADIAMLVGVGLIILGFFLPWVYIRMPNITGLFGQSISRAYQAGYHTGAIGWAVFVTAIISAMPVFVTPKNMLYKILMLQIFLTIIGTVPILFGTTFAVDKPR